ncbi:hypothetical protein CON15_19685 [Bacillus cereus]|uniref:Serine acetyltransferase n=1 Tax=Bacillus thuringiensis TaxID=1428 RepID=A0AB36VGC2_BACTU|nr:MULTISPECIES: hypothetical protein [Bacillus cereus group]MDO6628838.1 hypothetical protein [Bacillus thuringiensis]MDO6659242.1 hypothetical protein [Bacillus thuringiensis]MDO6698824.1 hypothetical protein [Bacillus thuringiensis]MEB9467847.1 hypothetical protein [Bacillus cereus]MEC0031133.1 hypothetical protein [Bacillus cereus]
MREQHVLILKDCKKGFLALREIEIGNIEPTQEFIRAALNQYQAKSATAEKRYINNETYHTGGIYVGNKNMVVGNNAIAGHITV